MSTSDPDQPTSPTPSDPAAIESEIEQTRARLAGTVDELAVRLHPKEIGRRTVQDAKDKVRSATTADGKPRVERLAAAGASVVALAGLLVARRRRG